jgi:thiosulfate/3-mercaptopyruvate sulfurtransferase
MQLRPLRCAALCWVCGMLLAALSTVAFAQPATELPASHLIAPQDLVHILQSNRAKPLIFNVGPRFLYEQGHIPGAEYAGPGSDPQTLKQLHERAQMLPRNSFIVLYCGCCPWVHCPNVNPAFHELSRMGFSNVKVLKIENNFGTDWVDKQYPTMRG